MKKLFVILLISGSLVACNDNAGEGGTNQDSADGVTPVDTTNLSIDTSSSVRIDSTLKK